MKFAIYNHKLINVKDAKRHLIYKCPLCGKRLVYHKFSGKHKAYFAHVLSNNRFNNPGETSEHLRGKRQLAHFFKTSNNTVTIEKYLSKINQWPDLMVNNKVIEFQCSPISTETLMARNAGYSKLNLESWWVLGSPYQKRRLRPSYIARFLNYSTKLGFFIFFWKVKTKCLVIHYGISEQGGRLSYRVRRFNTINTLRHFFSYRQLTYRHLNHFIIKRSIISEMKINRRRLFYGDAMLINLQQLVSQRHNTLLGCPVVCHLPVYDLPIFKKRGLLWRIIIILMIRQSSNLWDVYHQANVKVGLPLTFCQIKGYNTLYRRAFLKYISLLAKYKYIKIDVKHKKITRLREPRWFNSYYDKLIFLRTHY